MMWKILIALALLAVVGLLVVALVLEEKRMNDE